MTLEVLKHKHVQSHPVAPPKIGAGATQQPHPTARAASTPKPNMTGKGDPGPLYPAVSGARARAVHGAAPTDLVAAASSMQTSRQGRLFIANEEEQKNVSNHLHHPSASSGVTLGPGYDMLHRSAKEITTDLVAIGVSSEAATKIAVGSRKTGADADRFAHENKALVDLDAVQQAALLNHVVGRYEAMVRSSIHVPLHQCEFDALVSFAYNPGKSWSHVTQLINNHDRDEAMKAVHRVVTSGGKVMGGLVVRRDREVRLFLYGEYK